MQVSVGTLGDPQKDSDLGVTSMAGVPFTSRQRQKPRYTLTEGFIDFVCLLLNLGHFGQKWPLHAHNVYAVVDVGTIYVS